MFLVGNQQHTLDDKKRIRLPAKHREQLGNSYILMPGMDGCIFVYGADEQQKMLQTIEEMGSSFDPAVAEWIRSIAEYAATVEADSQGRFMIPQDLLEISGIQKDVRIVGAISRVEIWSEERYLARRNSQDHSPTGLNGLYINLHKAMSK